jgi:hypothetical protein
MARVVDVPVMVKEVHAKTILSRETISICSNSQYLISVNLMEDVLLGHGMWTLIRIQTEGG